MPKHHFPYDWPAADQKLYAQGFTSASGIAAYRIVGRYISSGNPLGVEWVKRHFGITENDFLDMQHEYENKVPGKWAKHFSKAEPLVTSKLSGDRG